MIGRMIVQQPKRESAATMEEGGDEGLDFNNFADLLSTQCTATSNVLIEYKKHQIRHVIRSNVSPCRSFAPFFFRFVG
jgi:hypothetical protein